MSGAERTTDQIANDVFHALHPECPAFPGIPNACDPQVCDCFNCEHLPEKVMALIAALRPFAQLMAESPAWKNPALIPDVEYVHIHLGDLRRAAEALAQLEDVRIEDIL